MFAHLGQTNWTYDELVKVKTFENTNLSVVEKEAIMYINMARMFPLKFVELELKDYWGTELFGDYLINSSYKISLISALKKSTPIAPLIFDETLQEYAACFAKEQGLSGTRGHERKRCAKGTFAECISYGCATGKDIAMQLLIDHKVESLGHRKICLDPSYSKVGIKFNTHRKSEYCAVIDLYK